MIIAVKYKKRKETLEQNTTTTTVNPAISIIDESVITACFLGPKERLLVP